MDPNQSAKKSEYKINLICGSKDFVEKPYDDIPNVIENTNYASQHHSFCIGE